MMAVSTIAYARSSCRRHLPRKGFLCQGHAISEAGRGLYHPAGDHPDHHCHLSSGGLSCRRAALSLPPRFSLGLCGVTFLPVYLLGLYWKGVTRAGAMASMVGGLGVSFIWMIFFHYLGMAALFGLANPLRRVNVSPCRSHLLAMAVAVCGPHRHCPPDLLCPLHMGKPQDAEDAPRSTSTGVLST